MKRRIQYCIVGAAAGLTVPVLCAGGFDEGWRISVGASYNAPAKVGLHFSPAKFNTGRITPPVAMQTRAEADRKVSGTEVTATRRNYTADGKVFVDTDDYRKAQGGLETGTWNVSVPYDSWDGTSFELASAEYVEVRKVDEGRGELRLDGSDESAMPGVSVELSRNLYHNAEYRFGVDAAFLFSYFFKTDLYESRSEAQSAAYAVERGVAKSSIAPVSGVREELWRDEEGYYGAGSYDGPGPVFNDPVISHRGSSTLFRNGAKFHAWGDYRELEMAIALRPYYDILDWLRFYATIGLAVSWSEFDLNVAYQLNGAKSRYSREYDAWDVYGIGGLGLMARWRDFTFGVDFFARFLQDDLAISDELVRGSLQRGTWTFRAMVGYEF